MTLWGSPRKRFATRLSTMNALVGGGIQRKQTTGVTVNAARASSARQRIRRSRENVVLLDTAAEVIELAVPGGCKCRHARSRLDAIPFPRASQDERISSPNSGLNGRAGAIDLPPWPLGSSYVGLCAARGLGQRGTTRAPSLSNATAEATGPLLHEGGGSLVEVLLTVRRLPAQTLGQRNRSLPLEQGLYQEQLAELAAVDEMTSVN